MMRMNANEWDRLLDGLEGDPYRKYVMLPAILGLLPKLQGKKLLDIGVGNGFLIPHLLQRKPARVVGVDHSRELLAIARTRLPQKVALCRADVTKRLRLKDAPFDAAVANFVISEVRNIGAAYRNIYRQLKPGALLIVGILHPAYSLAKHLREGNRAVPGYGGYFNERRVTEVYREKDRSMNLRLWHRPLASHLNTPLEAGFSIERVVEPKMPDVVVRLNPFYKPYQHVPLSLYFLLRRAK